MQGEIHSIVSGYDKPPPDTLLTTTWSALQP